MLMTVKCPICRKDAPWDEKNPFRPFCSERCKLRDLGAWASDEYRIPGKPHVDDPDDERD
jgi:hypothetical protein